MNILVVLIPVSVGMGLIGLTAFVWALRGSQYDDTEGDRHRILDPRWDDAPRGPAPPPDSHRR